MAIVRNVSVFQSLLLASAIALVGCGGGGGGGDPTPPNSSTPVSSPASSAVSNSTASVIPASSTSSDSSGNEVSSSTGSQGVSSSALPISSSSEAASSVAPPDTTPNTFAFSGVTNAEPGIAVVSPAVEITGINTATAISITGGEYSIDGGGFTTAAGTINNGQTLTVRTIASDKTNTPVDVTVTVGGVSATFTVTTLADVTPDAFLFTAKTDVAVNTEETSEPVTIKGIDIPVPVSITGGLYSINGGEFTASAGTVSADQTIVVKTTSGASTEVTQSAVLTVGDVNGTFSVTTVLDTTPPVAEFKFPTPYTMSEANEVKVRGVATDDHAITSVKVVVNGAPGVEVTPTAPGDYSSWTATVSLSENSENEIKLIAIDERENETVIEQANKVVIRQRVDYKNAFPDSGSPIDFTDTLLLDRSRNRLLYSTNKKIYEISIDTASSKVFTDFGGQLLNGLGKGTIDKSAEFAYIPVVSGKSILKLNLSNSNEYSFHQNGAYGKSHTAIAINDSDRRAILISALGSSSESEIVSTDLDSWEATILPDNLLTEADSTLSFGRVNAVAYDQKNNRYFFASWQSDAVYTVDVVTGKRKIFSNESIGTGDAYGAGLEEAIQSLALDLPRNRLIVPEMITGNIFAVDLDTADRMIISKMTLTHPTSNIWPDNEKNYIGAEIDTENELLYTVHHRVKALMVVDLQSGQQLVLSKAAN